jgi:hypothetical protein
MAISWGNPDTNAFDRQNLRYSTHGDQKIRVHRLIWPLVNRILVGLDQAGVSLHSLATNEADPIRISFVLHVDDPVMVGQLLEPAMFVVEGDLIIFKGTPEQATDLSTQIGHDANQIVDDVEPDEEEITLPAIAPDEVERINTDGFKVGDKGLNVTFVQYLMGRDPTGVFSGEDFWALCDWQKRHYCTPTGTLDAETLSAILPRRAIWLRPGATGQYIRVLQAAFLALQVQTAPISGVWGIRFSKAVRAFQTQRGLMIRQRVGNPEWEQIFSVT